MVGKLGHVKQVVGDAAHDLADFGIIIIGMVQPQQMVKGVAAHVGLDMHTHDMPDAGHKVAGRAVDDAQYKVQSAIRSTVSTVSAAAETVLVSVRMMVGRAISHSVVSAAQNKSKNSTPLYLIR